jgi:hypothetical protein
MAPSTSAASSGDTPVTFDRLPPRWEPTPLVPQRPLGVAILSVLIAIFAFVLLLAGILYVLSSYLGSFVPASLELIPSLDIYGAAIVAVLGAALLGIATALWNQETWALWTTIVLVFATTAYLFFTESITVLFLVFIVLFLYLISVRRYFY